jgi:hypothetical protein
MAKKRAHCPPSGDQTVATAGSINHKLHGLGGNSFEAQGLDTLSVDITDIYDICTNYQRLVDKFVALPNGADPEKVLRIIADLEMHMDIHLSYHLKRFLKGLRTLEKVVQPDKRKRDEFALKTLDEAHQRVQCGEYWRSPNLSED